MIRGKVFNPREKRIFGVDRLEKAQTGDDAIELLCIDTDHNIFRHLDHLLSTIDK